MASNNDFDKVLLESIDEALDLLGESGKKILYYHTRNKFTLNNEIISKNPELFFLALRNLLGAGGAFIETLVLTKLCEKLGLDCKGFTSAPFEDAIQQIKQHLALNESSM